MPLGAMLNSTLLIGVKTSTQEPTGEWTPSYSYTNALPISCRIYDSAVDVRRNPFGITLKVDCIALVAGSTAIQPMLIGSNTGEDQQCKVDGVLYTIKQVKDVGHMGRLKAVGLVRWK